MTFVEVANNKPQTWETNHTIVW